MVKKVLTKHRYSYPSYELLLCRLLKDEPLTPDDDSDLQSRTKKQQSHDDDSAEIEAVSFKKFPLDVNSLTKVRVGWVHWVVPHVPIASSLGLEYYRENIEG
jgi:hypothetical protein